MDPRRGTKKSQRDGAPQERRRARRFEVMLRVDYTVGGRSTFSFSSNLITSGVNLRGATRI